MTDGDVVTPDRSVAPPTSADSVSGGVIEHRLAGHAATLQLLTAQSRVPPRSRFARLLGKSPLSAETSLLYRGVVGEIEVGEALARLGHDWVVLHALPVDAGEADIDHLVIGPSGVYVVATTNHSGQSVWASERTLIVGGVRYPHIRNMEFEMGRAERMLSAGAGTAVEVSGILAIVAPKSLTIRDRHRDVAVLQSTQLVPWLLRRKRTLSDDDIRLITDAAALATTWFQGEEAAVEPESLRIRFETLRAAVHTAWHVQVTWAVIASVLAVGGFGALIYSILVTALRSP
jgi:hypothetical protein